MTPTASPRHPWKAIAVVILMFAAVHGVRAHTGWHDHDHGFGRVHVVDSSDDADADVDVDDNDNDDCPGIDVRIQDGRVRINGHDITVEHIDDTPAIDVIDGREWS
jgi:hypothetical protein